MRNKKSDRIKKSLAILLIICFAFSVIAAPANAAENNKGYKDGYKKGYRDGKSQGHKDCNQYGSRDTLSKIPSPPSKSSWTSQYINSFNEGYKKGFIDGYNENRYNCLK